MLEKFAIFLLSGTGESAKAYHALLFAQELAGSGMEVKLIFDGAGSAWIAMLSHPEHVLNQLYNEVKKAGLVEGVCDYCAGRFGTTAASQAEGLKLLGGVEKGHPSLVKLIKEGYQPIII